MKAMILSQVGPVEQNQLIPAELDPPEAAAHQVLIKVEACGLCHTDLHEIEGELPLPKLPLIPGHQVVGRVEKAAPDVDNLEIGDRVGLAWLGRTCGVCEFCGSERENLCPDAKFTGFDFDGGYAEYTAAHGDFVYPIPENVSAQAAAPLLCAGIIGYRALRLSNIQPGQLLGLYGFGASAHITIQIARHWGCDVYVFSRSVEHRQLAEKLGAAWTGEIGDNVPKKLHGSIIFAPAGELVPPALEHLEKAGTCALAGIYMSPTPSLDYEKHLYYEKILRSVSNSTRRDGLELMKLAGEINLEITTQPFALAEVNRALQLLKVGKINGAAVLNIL